jgi:hypothetical protein
MKRSPKSKNSNQVGLVIAISVLITLALIVGNEIFHHRFALVGYAALTVISPLLVLLVSDWVEFRKLSRR